MSRERSDSQTCTCCLYKMAALLSGCLSDVSCSPTRNKRVFLGFSTHDRKRSEPRRNNSRRHTQSRCITSLCASGMPTAMALRSKKTILRRRLSMYCCIVLTHYPVKQAPPQKPALRGSLPINNLLRPSLPPTTRTLQREFPGEPSTPGGPLPSRSGTMLRKP